MAEPARAPTVSAIIVVRNGMPYIAEAIESVLSQTFDDWELLIVDDGSTDETPEVLRGFAADVPGRTRLLSHPRHRNLGIAASRNLGIEAARGLYVAFLDADDVWLPEKLAEQVALLGADPALGMVYGRTLIWHEWDPEAIRRDFFYELGVDADARYDPPALFELLMENWAQTPTTCNAMIRASLFRRIGRFDPAARGMFEDLSFFGRATALLPAYVSDRTWAKYRQHAASCTAVSSASGADEWARFIALRRLDRTLKEHALPERARRALRRAQMQSLAHLARRWPRMIRQRLRHS